MNLQTYGQIRTKVINDLDLQNETNISADEMVGYVNEAVLKAQSEIHTLYKEYFLKSGTLTLVNGTATYPLPSDIFGQLIRGMIYNNGAGVIYPVKQIRGERKFIDIALSDQFGTALDYRYYLKNTSSAVGYQVVLSPPSREDGAFITLWYIRAANIIPLVTAGSQAASDAIVVDIPEFYTFIIQFMKLRCLEKDGADPRIPQASAMLAAELESMVSTLTNRIPDDDDQIQPDFSHYYEHE